MSFTFTWPHFSDRFHQEARETLYNALNKGSKPPIIADEIQVVELDMGSQPPELEIKDVGELTKDQFRGIFKLTYSGDAFIVLRTKVQANPLTHRATSTPSDGDTSISSLLGGGSGSGGGILAAHQPLVVPMLLRLSQFRLNSYVVLVLSKQKGCTLVFKTDPLQTVQVSSTFDSVAVIQSFIQREIEDQLREMFREDLPGIIHRLSQRWVAGRTRVEAPYLRGTVYPAAPSTAGPHSTANRPRASTKAPSTAPPSSYREEEYEFGTGVPMSAGLGIHPGLYATGSPSGFGIHRRGGPSSTSSRRPPPSINPPSSISGRTRSHLSHSPRTHSDSPRSVISSDFPQNPHSSMPDIENFDPTYGLRSDSIPHQTTYSGLGKLFGANRGLADLARGGRGELGGLDGESTYDVVEWDDETTTGAGMDDVDDGPPPLPTPLEDLETIPAVGGGFVTRLRPRRGISSSSTTGQTPYGETRRGTSVADQWSEGGNQDGDSRGAYNPYFGEAYREYRREEEGMSSRSPPSSAPPVFTRSQIGSKYGHHRVPDKDDIRRGPRSYTRRDPQNHDQKRNREGSFDEGPNLEHLQSRSSSPFTQPTAVGMSLSDEDVTDGFIAHDNLLSHTAPDQQQRNWAGSLSRRGGGIILRNQSVTQLSALSRSNQTLSPFTRSFSHFTVRSGPPKSVVSNTMPFPSDAKRGGASAEVKKARRKRVHRIGAARVVQEGNDKEKKGAEKEGERRPRAAAANVKRYTGGGDISFGRKTAMGGRGMGYEEDEEDSEDDVEHYFRTRRPSETSRARRDSSRREEGVPLSPRPSLHKSPLQQHQPLPPQQRRVASPPPALSLDGSGHGRRQRTTSARSKH